MTALHESTIATDELRPTRVEVDLDVLAENYRAIAAHVAPARVMPILKANAYGHGLVEVGRVVERLGAPYSGFASTACACPCWCSGASWARRSRASSRRT